MKLFWKKNVVEKMKATNSTITKLDKNQLESVIGGASEGEPIGGIIVKGGRNQGGQANSVSGQPIGGIIVKGGRNPGGQL